MVVSPSWGLIVNACNRGSQQKHSRSMRRWWEASQGEPTPAAHQACTPTLVPLGPVMEVAPLPYGYPAAASHWPTDPSKTAGDLAESS